jgi:hypothetical protein
VLSTILDSAGCITQWWKDVLPGDVVIFPARAEFDGISAGGAGYLAVSIPLPELSSMLGGEENMADPEFSDTKRLSNLDLLIGAEMLQRFLEIISGIKRRFTAPSDQAGDFLQRAIIDCFVFGLKSASQPSSTRSHTGLRLVGETDDYIDAAAGRPIHISELCGALNVSRRNLHRAFADTLGIGPGAYLRFQTPFGHPIGAGRMRSSNDFNWRLGIRVRVSGSRPLCRLLSCPFLRDAVRPCALDQQVHAASIHRSDRRIGTKRMPHFHQLRLTFA